MFRSLYILHILVFVLLVGTNAQRDKTFFRKDFKYIEETESFYKIHTISKNFEHAREMCEIEGAQLFYPNDEAEANAVISYWNLTQPFEFVYIGVSAPVVKGVFETIDNIPISDVYNNWEPGEPNDAGDENCVQLKKSGVLNDVNCDYKYPFICKKTLATLQWNTYCHIPNMDYEYSEITGKCYKFHLDPANWADAYAKCSWEQAYLAVLDSQAEADYLKQITEKAPKDNIKGNFMSGAVLLGFHNRSGKGWRTIKGVKLEDSGYSTWGNAQPDGGDNEKCGSMFYNGHLNDISCDTKAFFICEHDVDILGSLFDERFAAVNTTV